MNVWGSLISHANRVLPDTSVKKRGPGTAAKKKPVRVTVYARSRNTNPFGLTDSQADVMDGLVRWGASKAVCAELSIVQSTLEQHVSAVVKQMGVTNRMLAVLEWDRFSRQAS